MWKAKFIVPNDKGMLVGSKTLRHNVTVMGYPLSHYKKGKKFFLLASGYLIGSPKAKKEFIKDLRKDKRSIKIDMMDESFGFWLMEQHPINEMWYDPLIIYLKPTVITNEGNYIFEIASWDRKKIETIAKKLKSAAYKGDLIYIKKERIQNITIRSMSPKLTEKQRRAIELAVENGYYGYPRKINVQKLAGKMNISYSTFQFHLRNAEKKIIPYFFQNS